MLLKTRAILVVVVGIGLGLSLSLSGGLIAARQVPDSDDLTLEQARLLAEVMQRVKHDYVEPIDDNVLLDNAIRGMVSDLDAHSQYLDADEYRDIRISTTGSCTGIGIEVSDIPKALGRFHQVDSDLNRKYEGTGLGLPLAKAMVEQHGGGLDLQSRGGGGT